LLPVQPESKYQKNLSEGSEYTIIIACSFKGTKITFMPLILLAPAADGNWKLISDVSIIG
jgi:hypothetical protein|tara:strand:+ start:335 stop:514 length:180 start_codon:yes stop_codon:yes gene_type:complete